MALVLMQTVPGIHFCEEKNSLLKIAGLQNFWGKQKFSLQEKTLSKVNQLYRIYTPLYRRKKEPMEPVNSAAANGDRDGWA